jgi:tetratricopeptide (TPR) repeat protein
MFMYPRWEVQAGQPLAYLPALAAVAGLGILWRNRNVWARASLLAVGCFIAMVFPVLAIFNQFFFRYSFVNDHFLYLPGIGPLALAAAGISSTLLWINNKNVVPNWLPAGALLLLLGVLTWNQTGIYRSSEALWNDTLEKNPDSWMAHNNLGHIVLARGQVDEAAAHYSRAHLINPHDPVVSYDLAVALSVQGKFEDAVQHYREAVALDPGYFAAYNNLGNALMRLQRIDEAMDAYQSALRLNPTNSGVLNNLGGALLGRKQYAEAAGYLKTASQSAPGSVETHFNLGQAYEGLGKRDEAVKEFTEALRLKPDFVPARQHLQALEAGIGK